MTSGTTDPAAVVHSDSLDESLCPECAYSLRGLTSQRCPECGLDLAPLRSAESRIPWVHRRERGRFVAFWQTVFFVMFRHRQFRAEMVRPVSLRDAQRFRWIVVWVVYLTFIALWPIWRWLDQKLFEEFGRDVDATLVNVGFVVLFPWLAAVTGVHTYFFHPRWMPVALQNRAVALSYYMVAPLGVFPALVAFFVALTLLVRRLTYIKTDELVAISLICIFVATSTPWYLDIIRLSRQVLRRSLRTLVIGLVVPMAVLLLSMLMLVLVPAGLLYGIALLWLLF